MESEEKTDFWPGAPAWTLWRRKKTHGRNVNGHRNATTSTAPQTLGVMPKVRLRCEQITQSLMMLSISKETVFCQIVCIFHCK
jgi:hypothetical protein